ncbi:hypothetical protein GUJ93_ZPchr0002g24312 [Zizania palustris]|uniref:Uncharacterized protein n=1 Tax=Zizania palustris TaxID=103762 RepID=A0A8J5VQS8_ZIZPA|nr:hypothetical protein GUJ93_ZPchr0002g24312 [Zizania palustris]
MYVRPRAQRAPTAGLGRRGGGGGGGSKRPAARTLPLPLAAVMCPAIGVAAGFAAAARGGSSDDAGVDRGQAGAAAGGAHTRHAGMHPLVGGPIPGRSGVHDGHGMRVQIEALLLPEYRVGR